MLDDCYQKERTRSQSTPVVVSVNVVNEKGGRTLFRTFGDAAVQAVRGGVRRTLGDGRGKPARRGRGKKLKKLYP